MIKRLEPFLTSALVELTSNSAFRRGYAEQCANAIQCGEAMLLGMSKAAPQGSPALMVRSLLDILLDGNKAVEQHLKQLDPKAARWLAGKLRDVGLKMCAALLDTMAAEVEAGTFNWTVRMAELEGRIKDELTEHVAVFLLEESKTKFLAKGSALFGEDFRDALSKATYDVEQAAYCLSLELSTAAVFHLMRVMEFVLRDLGERLGIPDPVAGKRTWFDILKAIRTAMDARDWRNRKGERQHYDAAVSFLDGVRTAWRNDCMHVTEIYAQDSAEQIHNRVATFAHELLRAYANPLPPLAPIEKA